MRSCKSIYYGAAMSPIQLEHQNCPLGCKENDKLLFQSTDLMHGLPGVFNLVCCQSCGLIRTNPRPTAASMSYYYPSDYSPYLHTQVHRQHGCIAACKKGLIKQAKKNFEFNERRLPSMPAGRMLELGCASGSFLHEMAEQGWQVEGIEYHQASAEQAASLGYQVHTGAIENCQLKTASYDLIVAWMVLEHLHQPVESLKKLCHAAKQDAYLCFSVPNAEAIDFTHFKHYGYAVQVPNHLYHFTPRSIEKILTATGWKLEKVYHHRSFSNILASIGYALHAKGYARLARRFIQFPTHSAIWHCLFFPIAYVWGLIGQSGRITVWARKRND